jgi:hypothetical protein
MFLKKVLKYQFSSKSIPLGTDLFHADGRAGGHDEANSRFSQFFESVRVLEEYAEQYRYSAENN